MQTDDIDRIIAEALEEEKGRKGSRWHRPKKKAHDPARTKRIRNVLNTLFMLGFVAAIALYFLMPDNRVPFFCVGFGALLLKIAEFFVRFLG